jgi:hypothetical protein
MVCRIAHFWLLFILFVNYIILSYELMESNSVRNFRRDKIACSILQKCFSHHTYLVGNRSVCVEGCVCVLQQFPVLVVVAAGGLSAGLQQRQQREQQQRSSQAHGAECPSLVSRCGSPRGARSGGVDERKRARYLFACTHLTLAAAEGVNSQLRDVTRPPATGTNGTAGGALFPPPGSRST